MAQFALSFDPAAAPVFELIGHGFRPAWQPADFIGPRLDCPMWLPAPDADIAYLSKYNGPLAGIDPYAPLAGHGFGTDLLPDAGPQVTAAQLAGTAPGAPVYGRPSLPGNPGNPGWPGEPWMPCCIIREPDEPAPQPSPVPIEAGSAVFLIAAIGALFARGIWQAMGRFGDWFTAERGIGDGQNGWVG